MSEVAITGVGVATPFGFGKEAFLSGMNGERDIRIGRLHQFRGTLLEEQKRFLMDDRESPGAGLPRKLLKFMSKGAKIGCRAGVEAAQDSGICEEYAPEEISIYAAGGLTAANPEGAFRMLGESVDEEGRFSERLFAERGLGFMNPLTSFQILPNMPPCILSIIIKARGNNMVFNPWEEQGAAAIYEGFQSVGNGETGCALVGAADTPDEAGTLVCLRQMGLINEEMAVSSGAAYLVLEKRERAEKDGRKIYGLIHAIKMESFGKEAKDPLAEKMGRTFAASPALLVAAYLLGVTSETSLVGSRGSLIEFEIERMKKP